MYCIITTTTPFTCAQELTDVINWVLEQWNTSTLPDNFEMLTLEEVVAARKEILADPLRYRIENWKDYPE